MVEQQVIQVWCWCCCFENKQNKQIKTPSQATEAERDTAGINQELMTSLTEYEVSCNDLHEDIRGLTTQIDNMSADHECEVQEYRSAINELQSRLSTESESCTAVSQQLVALRTFVENDEGQGNPIRVRQILSLTQPTKSTNKETQFIFRSRKELITKLWEMHSDVARTHKAAQLAVSSVSFKAQLRKVSHDSNDPAAVLHATYGKLQELKLKSRGIIAKYFTADEKLGCGAPLAVFQGEDSKQSIPTNIKNRNLQLPSSIPTAVPSSVGTTRRRRSSSLIVPKRDLTSRAGESMHRPLTPLSGAAGRIQQNPPPELPLMPISPVPPVKPKICYNNQLSGNNGNQSQSATVDIHRGVSPTRHRGIGSAPAGLISPGTVRESTRLSSEILALENEIARMRAGGKQTQRSYSAISSTVTPVIDYGQQNSNSRILIPTNVRKMSSGTPADMPPMLISPAPSRR